MKRMGAVALMQLALLFALAPEASFAQDYPTRPIRILSPYAPGGISDIAARIVGGKLTEAWGQQVIVENRPGGNGFIAVADAARAAPDGYTLVTATAGDVTINPSRFKNTVAGLRARWRCLVCGISGRKMRSVSVCAHQSAPLDSHPWTNVAR